MEPTTLRLSEDLKEALDEEADAAGFSSRSEYIRYLLAHRDMSSTTSQSDTDQATSDTGLDEGVLEELAGLRDRLESIEDRVGALETDVAALQSTREQEEPTQESDEGAAELSPPSGETTEGEAFRGVEEWLDENGPESEVAREILLDAARLLDERGPLQAGELRETLYEQYPDAYGSANTLWSATVSRWYEDIPGFEKPERGTYRFNPSETDWVKS